jgi:hypothetical protein
MAREVSLEALRSLRLNLVLSHSLQQAREVASLMSTPSAAQSWPNSSSLSLSYPRTTMMSSAMEHSTPPMFAMSSPSLFTHPTVTADTWLESHGAMAAPRRTANPVVQYLQQQTRQRTCTRHCESGGGGGSGSGSSGESGFESPAARSISQDLVSSNDVCTLPAALSRSTDGVVLSKFQVFLRLHIEAFAATSDDVSSRIRGRYKQVRLNQVGIRCRYCAHVPTSERLKGAVYFPSSTMGFYQAAQNMNSTHLQCGLCPEMPKSTKNTFAQLIGTKTPGSSSMGGRAYWGHCAQQMGLVDTDLGIFAARM